MTIEKLATEFPEVRTHLEQLRRSHARMNGIPLPPLPVRAPPPPPRKPRIKKIMTTLRLSPEVVEEFKASGPGWQTRMDAELLRLVTKKEGTA